MPDLPRDQTRPEDVDSNAEDHWYDAGRYLLMGAGGGPSFFVEPDPDPDAPPPLVGGPEPDQMGQPLPGGRFVLLPE